MAMKFGAFFLVASLLELVSCKEKEISLPSFDLLSVNSLMNVQVVVDKSLSAPSLKLDAAEDSVMSLISSDVWPTAYGFVLVLGRSPSSVWSDPVPVNLGSATLKVPKPLLSISASSGSSVHVDVAGGSVFSDSTGMVTVSKWTAADTTFPISFRSSSRGKTIIQGGEKVNHAYIGASSEGVVVVATEVQTAHIDASSQGQVTVNAIGSVNVVCSSNAVISTYGGGEVRETSTWGCGGISKAGSEILP